MANKTLYWHRPFSTVRSGALEDGDVAWFPEGGLNASYNCVDRYVLAFLTFSHRADLWMDKGGRA
jgi:hypothetical protein